MKITVPSGYVLLLAVALKVAFNIDWPIVWVVGSLGWLTLAMMSPVLIANTVRPHRRPIPPALSVRFVLYSLLELTGIAGIVYTGHAVVATVWAIAFIASRWIIK